MKLDELKRGDKFTFKRGYYGDADKLSGKECTFIDWSECQHICADCLGFIIFEHNGRLTQNCPTDGHGIVVIDRYFLLSKEEFKI